MLNTHMAQHMLTKGNHLLIATSCSLHYHTLQLSLIKASQIYILFPWGISHVMQQPQTYLHTLVNLGTCCQSTNAWLLDLHSCPLANECLVFPISANWMQSFHIIHIAKGLMGHVPVYMTYIVVSSCHCKDVCWMLPKKGLSYWVQPLQDFDVTVECSICKHHVCWQIKPHALLPLHELKVALLICIFDEAPNRSFVPFMVLMCPSRTWTTNTSLSYYPPVCSWKLATKNLQQSLAGSEIKTVHD